AEPDSSGAGKKDFGVVAAGQAAAASRLEKLRRVLRTAALAGGRGGNVIPDRPDFDQPHAFFPRAETLRFFERGGDSEMAGCGAADGAVPHLERGQLQPHGGLFHPDPSGGAFRAGGSGPLADRRHGYFHAGFGSRATRDLWGGPARQHSGGRAEAAFPARDEPVGGPFPREGRTAEARELPAFESAGWRLSDRKSTRLNSSH